MKLNDQQTGLFQREKNSTTTDCNGQEDAQKGVERGIVPQTGPRDGVQNSVTCLQLAI